VSSAKPDKFSAARLRSLLESEIAEPLRADYCVAFSGGADSTALLAGMAELAANASGLKLRALHVDHGLHRESADWARHACRIAEKLGVACTVESVTIDTLSGESVEAAARAARYAALAGQLAANEILLTAHHVDDQLETVLLQLGRGAGVAGFAAMPTNTQLGAGRHLRPLLGVTHAALLEFLAVRGLDWLDDPMNADPRFDRGFLRTAVIPILRKRWPAIATNVARSSRHMADAQRLLESLAEKDWIRARDGSRLVLTALAGLDGERVRNLLRYWIRREGRPLPSTDNLERLLGMMTLAAADSMPRVGWSGADVRRYRGRLYLAESFDLAQVPSAHWHWTRKPRFELGPVLGSMTLADGRGAAMLARERLPKSLEVRGDPIGAALRPAPSARRRTLRNLFQEHGVVPWVRGHIPLVYAGKTLVAVGDLWTEAQYQPQGDEPAVHIAWRVRPELY
jgi:tRNA(Ile)-lysidine synthase